MVIGKEVGESNTPHLQIYVEFSKAVYFNTIKKCLPTVHIEQAIASSQKNIEYCTKDNDYVIIGTPREQGKRNDLESFVHSVDTGMSKSDLIDEHPAVMCKYPKFYDTIKIARCEEKSKQRTEPPKIHILIGKPGSGKTRQVYDNHPIEDIYVVNHGDGSSSSLWFDGYYGQKVVLFDDFYGWVRYDLMLRLLDRYPLQVQTKGGYTWWCPEVIYITSNKNLDEWYPNITDKSALFRRVAS
jgi:hypothetical protein